MPQFYVSMRGGAYVLVEHKSFLDLARAIEDAKAEQTYDFLYLDRPDRKCVALDPSTVTLIQSPAPAATMKENHQ
jgi:hypothetical protein